MDYSCWKKCALDSVNSISAPATAQIDPRTNIFLTRLTTPMENKHLAHSGGHTRRLALRRKPSGTGLKGSDS